MRLYMYASRDAARDILEHGFQDVQGISPDGHFWSGVWLEYKGILSRSEHAPNLEMIVHIDSEKLDEIVKGCEMRSTDRGTVEYLLSASVLNAITTKPGVLLVFLRSMQPWKMYLAVDDEERREP